MRGLKPEDIVILSPLRGATVIQLCVGSHQVQFKLTPSANISVEGRCELIDEAGTLVDVWQRGRRSERFGFLVLLDQMVTDVTIDTPRSFTVKFHGPWRLRIVDDSDRYESFSVFGMFV